MSNQNGTNKMSSVWLEIALAHYHFDVFHEGTYSAVG